MLGGLFSTLGDMGAGVSASRLEGKKVWILFHDVKHTELHFYVRGATNKAIITIIDNVSDNVRQSDTGVQELSGGDTTYLLIEVFIHSFHSFTLG